MKHLQLFEKFEGEDIKIHLKKRGIDTEKTRTIIDEETEDVYFFLYNLSGKMIGYQKYNPNYKKTGQSKVSNPKMAKYFNWVTEEDFGRSIAVWGLESTKFTDRYLFVTEGIFDAARIQEAGYPAIALLCNDPSDSLKSWLATMPQKKIVIYDNDRPGRKLIKVGDYSYTVKTDKDINDLPPNEAKIFLDECLTKSGFLVTTNESKNNLPDIENILSNIRDISTDFTDEGFYLDFGVMPDPNLLNFETTINDYFLKNISIGKHSACVKLSFKELTKDNYSKKIDQRKIICDTINSIVRYIESEDLIISAFWFLSNDSGGAMKYNNNSYWCNGMIYTYLGKSLKNILLSVNHFNTHEVRIAFTNHPLKHLWLDT